MAEIVNLKRARKAKTRAVKEAEAGENRARFGVPKAARSLTKAQSEKAARDLARLELDPDKPLEK
jgi:hypothetical protein